MACHFSGYTHGLSVLKGLNSQRKSGQYCDCVIRLQLSPGNLYLAHRNVLAASSPVLASLLSSRGALLDLPFPFLTPETMGLLLEFIYTGKLPPPGLDDPVHSAAIYLEMDELRQVLNCRNAVSPKSPENIDSVANESNPKGRLVETQSLEENPLSPPCYLGSEWTTASPPSCEVVPVICHASTIGNYGGLLVDAQPQSSNQHSHDSGEEKEAETSDHTMGMFKCGYPSQYYGLQVSANHGVSNGSGHWKYPSVIADSKNDKSPHKQCTTTKEFMNEKSELKSKGKIVMTSSILCSESDDARIGTAQIMGEGSPLKHKKGDIIERSTVRNLLSERAPEQENIPNSDKSLERNVSHNDFQNGCSAFINQTGVDCEATSNVKNPSAYNTKTHAGAVDLKIPAIANEHTLEDKKCYLFTECHVDSQNSWGPEAISGDFIQIKEVHCGGKSTHSDPDLWNKTTYYSPKNPEISDDVIVKDTSTESHFAFQKDNNPGSPINDDKKKENLGYFSQRKSDFPAYQGQVTYHCLQKGRYLSSESDDDGLCTVTVDASVDVANVKQSPSAPCLVGISTNQEMCGSTETPAGIRDSAETRLQGAGGFVGAPAYRCAVCERAFSQRGSLNRHLRSHLGVRPYSCPQCPMTFSRQYRVSEHLRVHQRASENLQRTGPT